MLKTLGCCLTFMTMLAGPCAAAEEARSQIPPESLQMLQEMFGRVTELLWEKSDVYFHEGYHERCISVMRLIVEMAPSDVEAFSIGSWLMDSRDRPAEALAFLERGLSLNPNRYELYVELGLFHYGKKDYGRAAQYLETGVKFADCPVKMWHMLAHAYEKNGDLKRSVETWEHSAKLEPNDPVVENNLKRVREKLAAESKAVRPQE